MQQESKRKREAIAFHCFECKDELAYFLRYD